MTYESWHESVQVWQLPCSFAASRTRTRSRGGAVFVFHLSPLGEVGSSRRREPGGGASHHFSEAPLPVAAQPTSPNGER